MFLTVQEAIDLSGKSQTTIHRLCQKYDGSRQIRKERNKYLIDKDFLLEKYPPENKEAVETENFSAQTDEKLLQELNEKNERIVELSKKATELQEELKSKEARISELEDDLFDLQHELAETIDENINIGKELSAVDSEIDNEKIEIEQTSSFDLDAEKKAIRYNIAGFTISAMLLIAFIFMMYYLTK